MERMRSELIDVISKLDVLEKAVEELDEDEDDWDEDGEWWEDEWDEDEWEEEW